MRFCFNFLMNLESLVLIGKSKGFLVEEFWISQQFAVQMSIRLPPEHHETDPHGAVARYAAASCADPYSVVCSVGSG